MEPVQPFPPGWASVRTDVEAGGAYAGKHVDIEQRFQNASGELYPIPGLRLLTPVRVCRPALAFFPSTPIGSVGLIDDMPACEQSRQARRRRS